VKTRVVEFTLFAEQLAFYDEQMRLIVEPGIFKVLLAVPQRT